MLAHDDYDHSDDPYTISVTTLLKPVRSIILSLRITAEPDVDIHNLIPSKIGTALHTQLENTWKKGHYKVAMDKLGYPKRIIDGILINPTGVIPAGAIPIYLEQRTNKKIDKWTITGMFDVVLEDTVIDLKSCSTYNYISGSNNEKYRMQGSIYRWLNPEIIKNDSMNIEYLFTDWKRMQAHSKNYPPSQILTKKLQLLSIPETENFIRTKLDILEKNLEVKQADLPRCTPEELWQRDTVWKYYKDPSKRTRSTKNFTDPFDANTRLGADGNVGIVIEVPGEVVFCRYCSANLECTQAEEYVLNGLLNY